MCDPGVSSPDVTVLDDDDCVVTYPPGVDPKSSAPRPRGRPRRNTAANQPIKSSISSPAPEAFYSTPIGGSRRGQQLMPALQSVIHRPDPSSVFLMMGGGPEGVSQRIILPAGYTTAGGKFIDASASAMAASDVSLRQSS